jgi:hypothetical protein
MILQFGLEFISGVIVHHLTALTTNKLKIFHEEKILKTIYHYTLHRRRMWQTKRK